MYKYIFISCQGKFLIARIFTDKCKINRITLYNINPILPIQVLIEEMAELRQENRELRNFKMEQLRMNERIMAEVMNIKKKCGQENPIPVDQGMGNDNSILVCKRNTPLFSLIAHHGYPIVLKL